MSYFHGKKCGFLHRYISGTGSRKGFAILPDLLCCRVVEVHKYVCVPFALYLRQTCELHNPGLTGGFKTPAEHTDQFFGTKNKK